MKQNACVYVLECQGFYKIGKTSDLNERLKNIRAMNPLQVSVVLTIETPEKNRVELALHNIYAKSRISGEWFRLSSEEIDELRQYSAEEILSRSRKIKRQTSKSPPKREDKFLLELQPDIPVPPARGIPVPLAIIEQAFSTRPAQSALLGTFQRLFSLGWMFDYKRTAILNELALLKFLKLSRRHYYEQIAKMEKFGWIQRTRPGPGQISFSFPLAVEYDPADLEMGDE